MSAKRKPTPSYLRHKQSGRARAVWTDTTGSRQQRLLPGPYDSPESRTAFARLQFELETAPHAPTVTRRSGPTVNEVLLAFLGHAEQHYRRADGSNTHELEEYKIIIRHVRELYGDTPAAEFGPVALKALRQRFVGCDWCRNLINKRIGRVRRMFKWAASEELVPVTVFQALATVQGLQRGRSQVRESVPVGPVPPATVEATLPHLNRYVRALIQFQRLTGCRPGEACVLRRCDLDTTGPVWVFKPAQHKTAWRGKTRTIAVGPRAQELLNEFFTDDPAEVLFSPVRAVADLRAERSENRKTPRFRSHMARNQRVRVAAAKRKPTAVYEVSSYGHAIYRACDRAFPAPEPLAQRPGESRDRWRARLTAEQRAELKAWRKKHRWHPNQLRHLFATEVRKEFGLEAAQVLLGHARADITQVYAERDEQRAIDIAAKIG